MSVLFPSPPRVPVRTCVGCRKRADRSDLLRLVMSDTGSEQHASVICVVPDLHVRLPGRGAWIHSRRSCLELAEKRRAFARAFRRQGPFDLSPVLAHLEQVAS